MQSTATRYFLHLLYTCGFILLVGFGIPTAIAAPNSGSCALLNPTDLSTLLGGTPTPKDINGNCNWTVAGSKKKLLILNYHNHGGLPVDMMYMGARQNAHNTGKVADESGLGDKAFSVIDPAGLVVLMILTKGHMLQFQYVTITPGTDKDLAALKPLAKKAITAM
jgi:hypothetical protein